MQLCKVLVMSIFSYFYLKAIFLIYKHNYHRESNRILKKFEIEIRTDDLRRAVYMSIELETHFPVGFVGIASTGYAAVYLDVFKPADEDDKSIISEFGNLSIGKKV